MSAAVPPSRGRLPDRTANYAREFLSALFMSLRTAQIHDPSNQAYQSALTRLHQAADALYAASGGFQIRVVEDAFFVNGARLTFDQGSAAAMRTLRNLLEAQSLGGFTMESAPTVQGLLELIALIADRADKTVDAPQDELKKLNIGLLGPQRIVDGGTAKIDRATFAVHTYAKLILAIRERINKLGAGDAGNLNEGVPGEIRAIRVVQDLADLTSDRIDVLLKIATNSRGATVEELHGANTCVLSLAMGYSLGVHRRDLGDLGIVALLHHLGPRVVVGNARHHDLFIAAALARTLADSGVGRSLYARAMILSEQQTTAGSSPRKAHPFSRILRVAATYSRLVLGFGAPQGAAQSPIDALGTMRRDPTGWLDLSLVDLLINLLRVYPPGSQVMLKSGHYAVVSTPLNKRWDRPIVRVASKPPRSVDLMVQADGRFVNEIIATQQFLGAQPIQGQATAPPPSMGVLDQTPLPSGELSQRLDRIDRPEPSTRTSVPSLPELPRGNMGTDAGPRSLSLTPPGPEPGRRLPVPPSPSPMSAPSGPRRTPSLDDDLLLSRSRASLHPPPGAARSTTPSPLSEPAAIPRLDEPAPIVPTDDGAPRSEMRAPRGGLVRPDRLLGTFLAGKYRVLEKVGEGGMGTVFLASQEPIDRQVAIKVLHQSLANDDVAVARFKREARVISKMRHPNTVTIYDFGQTDAGELYLVMEFLEGQTVAQLLRSEGPLPGLRAARIIRQACGSLAEAHQLGIIHRDLKPDNIFLTNYDDQQDFVKVLDFGLVKLADNESIHHLTQQGKVYGTPRYMAPEQAEGKPIDHRSDIYTLGVVLYELLMGRPLFTAETMVALLVKHIQTPPPPMAAVRPDLNVDPRLESVVMWALAKKAADRPQTVKELAKELERWEQEAQVGGLTAPPYSAIPDAPSPSHHWTQGAPVEDLGGSLDSLLDGFLEELSPHDKPPAPGDDPDEPDDSDREAP